MIINLNKTNLENTHRLEALEQRAWRYKNDTIGRRIASQEPVKVEFRKIVYSMPLLFTAGIFTGIAIMLAIAG